MSGGVLGGGILGGGVPVAQQGTGLLGNMGGSQSTGIGFVDGFHNFTQENGAALLNMGAALLDGQGWGGGIRGFAQGMRQDEYTRRLKQAEAQEEQKRVKAQELASTYGLPAGMEADPDRVFSLVGQIEATKRTRQPTEWERLTEGLDKEELQKARRYRLGLETKPATTDDMLEYEHAKRDPAFAAFLRSQKGGANAPSGYTYGPDGKLAPIPGGPQDPDRDINDPLPGELAARFGLANQYFKRFEGIEKDLTSKDPRAVGPIDRFGFGQSGAIQRDMKLGSEAMIRMLTGAGMNKEEAENEVKQYLPGPYDSPETVLDKQKRLRAALRDMQREALAGRRSRRQIESEYPAFPVEPYSSNVRKGPIGHNRATTGAAATQGQTRSGVTWSAR